MKLLLRTALTAALFAGTLAGGYAGGTDEVVAQPRHVASGAASYYGKRFHGRTTANGERFNMNSMTAAHRTLPFGTKVKVTNRRNGKSVVVRINDRGPFHGKRIIDLSQGAASRIGMISSGTASVSLDVL
ncbi:septal ring lytic transglycosylase RlpA family protein [Aurantimonas sp. HBX-1]|uniref:septal ring lytic transglycosylase RlpA family protein n=1 Tax=Aurantimonas sp. HBX-1 TaxID=2906072 RepID=UPI001F46A958|nr:septal ring lytic transglycosylase RlpA family protein [Aurantimonas sp. HBX-1]UIJ72028.1 septal ring lytic transglycosylase RlpA family protein [Aurantimonas sp. HBX-1]